jgi:hypothetical protein
MHTPDFIEELKPNEIIVVGTNLNGDHAGGAAAYAREHFGLIDGCTKGLSGQTYALPTVSMSWNPLSVEQISYGVKRLLRFARFNPNLTFLVTKIGCGIAGHKESDIAALFVDVPSNVLLPKGWHSHPWERDSLNRREYCPSCGVYKDELDN